MKIKINNRLSQTLIPSLAMQQAFFVLQLPQIELAEWIYLQIEQNPLLEIRESKGVAAPTFEETELDFDKKTFEILDHLDESFRTSVFPEENKDFSQQELPSYPFSLFEHLKNQAQEIFSGKDLKQALKIIGNLDRSGFLGDTHVDESILKIIQSFDPIGVAARDLRDSLLIQLEAKGEANTLLYKVIAFHFQDLLQNKIPEIEKKLQIPTHSLKKSIRKKLFSLNFQPGAPFIHQHAPSLIPDIFVYKRGEEWKIDINDSYLPHINMSVPSIETLSSLEKAYVKTHLTKGKWLLHIIRRRQKTLEQITLYLLKYEQDFFNGNLHHLTPLNMQEAAKELNLNPSTIARITAHKYISSPQGIFPLRLFFSHALKTSEGQTISHHTVKQLLLDLIAKENKQFPLSDDRIVAILLSQGINCARRTITKYRKSLHIPPSQRRKE